ncbi:MAG: hypothetical protein IGS49_08790 [Chlorogloeopsis fritschii C42_A2020_084]|uniref:hypothetical protein n=1 Tax=Chlorogloeopsis fritschii TaxID=1124 RepID=UPI0019F2B10D|nr:hypothetical protein [Chlorogloeopsis fritschii]MBF2005550.1 hypothetical protein [Chlorogloeopsis fritschii C42_A2020_084]
MKQITEEETIKIVNQLIGSWRLPLNDHDSVSVSFFPNGNFFWTIAAYSTVEKVIQIFKGAEMQGNWQVRPKRKPPKILSKVNLFNTPNRELSVASSPGPFLILNFTDLPKSMLNLRFAGWQIDLANWVNNVLEVTRDGHYRILKFSSEEMQLETPEKKVEIWRKASGEFG